MRSLVRGRARGGVYALVYNRNRGRGWDSVDGEPCCRALGTVSIVETERRPVRARYDRVGVCGTYGSADAIHVYHAYAFVQVLRSQIVVGETFRIVSRRVITIRALLNTTSLHYMATSRCELYRTPERFDCALRSRVCLCVYL